MRRYLFLVIGMLIPVLSFAESTLSLGFQGSFGLMSGSSMTATVNGVDVTDLMDVEYNKSLLGIGFNLTGRFSGSKGRGGMGKIYSGFPLSYTHNVKTSATYSTLQSSSRKTYSGFEPAFIIGSGGGVLKRFTFDEFMFFISPGISIGYWF
ncbi:MAG: hypothetical protein LBD78_01530 [Spirochaetaceae bacterium]|jgi:hypothetical protein|nr:hypothetical protein [Spirochaetaceae bacterium]